MNRRADAISWAHRLRLIASLILAVAVHAAVIEGLRARPVLSPPPVPVQDETVPDSRRAPLQIWIAPAPAAPAPDPAAAERLLASLEDLPPPASDEPALGPAAAPADWRDVTRSAREEIERAAVLQWPLRAEAPATLTAVARLDDQLARRFDGIALLRVRSDLPASLAPVTLPFRAGGSGGLPPRAWNAKLARFGWPQEADLTHALMQRYRARTVPILPSVRHQIERPIEPTVP